MVSGMFKLNVKLWGSLTALGQGSPLIKGRLTTPPPPLRNRGEVGLPGGKKAIFPVFGPPPLGGVPRPKGGGVRVHDAPIDHYMPGRL